MYLVEIFLPLNDNDGRPFAAGKLADVRRSLTDQFGGVTAFTRTPAHGVSKEAGREVHDEVVVLEVMAERLDRDVWDRYRRHLEHEFAQDEVLIRATAVEKL